MAGTNHFKPFATGVGANVLTQADYEALTSIIANGFQSGVAESAYLNKVWRQGAFGAAALGQIIANSGADANDDGDLAAFVTNLLAAITSGVSDASTTTKGKVQLATSSESQALVNALKVLTPATLSASLQGGNQSLAANGYQKLPGGLIMQWGTATTNASGVATVTYPIAFPNAQLCDVSGSPVANIVVRGDSASTTTRTYTLLLANTGAAVGAGNNFRWFAIGY